MNVDKSINKLLQKEDCVVIPGFGGFVNRYESSGFDPQRSSFSPPRRIIGFNAQLCESDGLLTNFIAKEYQQDYSEVAEKIELQVAAWHAALKAGKTVQFDGIGEIEMIQHNLSFTPGKHQLPLLTSFGLGEVKGVYISRAEEIAPRKSYLSQTASYAAGIAFALTVGVVSLFANQQIIDTQWSSIIPLTQKTNTEHLYEMKAPVLQTNIEIMSAVDVPVAVNSLERLENSSTVMQKEEIQTPLVAHKGILAHQVIGGSFKKYHQAMEHEVKLRNDGFPHAAIIGKVGSYYMVAYETFATADEALAYHRDLRAQGKDAFVR